MTSPERFIFIFEIEFKYLIKYKKKKTVEKHKKFKKNIFEETFLNCFYLCKDREKCHIYFF